jgi:hypothetical protein
MRPGRLSRLFALLGAAPLLLVTAPVHATGITFTTPVQLTGPGGGEPSIATNRQGDVYVDGPQGIPSGVNGTAGVGFWVSHDNGSSFAKGAFFGSTLGGGDSDVVVPPDEAGTVYIDDLEAAAAAVCLSKDRGASFQSASALPDPSNCTTLPTGHAGPSDDRPWLTADKGGRVYLTYHEFVSAQPLIFRTDTRGQDQFLAGPCGSIITDPAIEANVPTDITGGTLVSKPVVDQQGNLYVLFTTTTQQENAGGLPGSISGTFSQAYLAVSTDHCQSFTDHTIFDGQSVGMNSVQFGDIFNDLAIDGGGNLYTVAAGYIGSKPPANPIADVFMFTSIDHGTTWSKPLKVNGDVGAHMLPAAVGGPAAGQLAIGYFRTVNGVTNPNEATAKWTYTAAETTNGTAVTGASFQAVDVNPGLVYHAGDVCNSGILCGSGAPGTGTDRSLLDFTSATIDGNGCVLFTFAGNPGQTADTPNRKTWNYVTRQTSGCFVPPAVTSTSGAVAAAGPAANAPTALPNTAPARAAAGGAVAVLAAGVMGGAAVWRRRRQHPPPA